PPLPPPPTLFPYTTLFRSDGPCRAGRPALGLDVPIVRLGWRWAPGTRPWWRRGHPDHRARARDPHSGRRGADPVRGFAAARISRDRKSTRLNSSHEWISYA